MDHFFEVLAKEYRQMIFAYLRTLVKDKDLAEDLTQETFIAAQKSIQNYNPKDDFGPWVRGIARNKALMYWRSQKKNPLVVDSNVVQGIEEVFSGMDRYHEGGDWWEVRKKLLRECIASLSTTLKLPLQEFYFKKQSLKQTAETLKSNSATIAQRLSRARKSIRTCINLKLSEINQNEI